MDLHAEQLIDRYIVEGVVGRGGMAVVYRARHRQLGTLHALKVLQVPLKPIQDRLLQEGRTQAQLQHPNIVTVTDVIDVDGSPGLIMEYVDGPTLEQLLQGGRLTDDQLDALAADILRGVGAAHRHGLVHRDLKPANILLKVVDDDLVAKVADFGMAKVLTGVDAGRSGTRSGATLGTPAYMAPEQIRNAKNVDNRADVWALGAVLYEMVTGTCPFDGDDLLDLFGRIAAGGYTPVSERRPDLPERMRRAIHGAMTVALDQRLPDCEAVARVWFDGDPPRSASRWDIARVRREQASREPAPSTALSANTLDIPAGLTRDHHTLDGSWVSGDPPPATAEPQPAPPGEPLAPEVPATNASAPMVTGRRLAFAGVAASLLALASGVAILVATLLALSWLAGSTDPSDAVADAPIDAPAPTDAPTTAAPATDAAPDRETAPEPTPMAPAPSGAPTTPVGAAPAPVADAGGRGRIQLEGDGTAEIMDASGKLVAVGDGWVPAGRYQVVGVTFKRKQRVAVSVPFVVTAAHTTSIRCSAEFETCSCVGSPTWCP